MGAHLRRNRTKPRQKSANRRKMNSVFNKTAPHVPPSFLFYLPLPPSDKKLKFSNVFNIFQKYTKLSKLHENCPNRPNCTKMTQFVQNWSKLPILIKKYKTSYFPESLPPFKDCLFGLSGPSPLPPRSKISWETDTGHKIEKTILRRFCLPDWSLNGGRGGRTKQSLNGGRRVGHLKFQIWHHLGAVNASGDHNMRRWRADAIISTRHVLERKWPRVHFCFLSSLFGGEGVLKINPQLPRGGSGSLNNNPQLPFTRARGGGGRIPDPKYDSEVLLPTAWQIGRRVRGGWRCGSYACNTA